MGIAEVDVEVGGQRQELVIGKFFTPVPGERAAEFPWQVLHLARERGHNAGGVFVLNLGQHHVARAALDQRGDVAVLGTRDQVAFPPLGDCAAITCRQ